MKVYVAIQYHENENDYAVLYTSTNFHRAISKAQELLMMLVPCFGHINSSIYDDSAFFSINDFHVNVVETELE